MPAMRWEIELKFKVDRLAGPARLLRAAGAEFLHTAMHMDCYFDSSDRELLQGGQGLRVRRVRLLRAGRVKMDVRPLLTFKGPAKPNTAAKVRPEVQTRVDDAQAVTEILAACGLQPMLTLQKRRATYRLGRSLVELDELPLIGCFVEIEAASIRAVQSVRRKLNLEGEPIEQHYVDLMLARSTAGRSRSAAGQVFTFDTCRAACDAPARR